MSEHNNNIRAVDFKINREFMSLSVVKLSIHNNINFSENLKQRFKRKISWNKDRSEVTTKPKVSNLDYMTDPTFRNINRFLVILFKNDDNAPKTNFLLSTTWLQSKLKGLKHLFTINCFLKTKN